MLLLFCLCMVGAAYGQYPLYNGAGDLVATVTVSVTSAPAPFTWTYNVYNELDPGGGDISQFKFWLRESISELPSNFTPNAANPGVGWYPSIIVGTPDAVNWITTVSVIQPGDDQDFTMDTSLTGAVLARALVTYNSTTAYGVVLVPSDPPVYQAYPGDTVPEFAQGMNQGYLGQIGDSITSVPGILAFDPGTDDDGNVNWVNFTDPCATENYDWISTTLEKVRPAAAECSDVITALTIGQTDTSGPPASYGIRRWWPLMYEPVGTIWTLTNDWSPGPSDTWTWAMDVTPASMRDLVELLHELPFGTNQVPLISDEILYWGTPAEQFTDRNHNGEYDFGEPFYDTNLNGVYDDVVYGIYDMLDNATNALAAFDYDEAVYWINLFEMEIGDRCIGESPPFPAPTGPAMGIADTTDNPACCKLINDAEFLLQQVLPPGP